jgi:signal transduction histidine kinase
MPALFNSWFQNLPIRRKIAAPMIAALAVMLSAAVFYFPMRHTQTLRKAYRLEAGRTAESVALAVAFALEERHFELLQITLSHAKIDANVAFIILFDETGERLAVYNPRLLPLPASFAENVAEDENEIIIISREISSQEIKTLGRLVLGYSLQELNEQLGEYRWATLGFTVVAFVLGLTFINQIARRITWPISELHAQMRETMERGVYSREVCVAAQDEVGRLAGAFNQMMIELHSRHQRLEESQARYRALYEKLKELDELKSNFVSDASHHLRTPLTIILGEIEVALRQEREPGAYKDVLNVVAGETKNLIKIVNNLLTLAKADAGNLVALQEEVDVSSICENEIRHAKILTKGKKLRIEHEVERNCLLTADPNRLTELFFNLLENAVKYTPAGKSIAITLASTNEHVIFKVTDEGPGIPRSESEHIFDRFYRGKVLPKKVKGTGLGLAICASIVKAHRGTIEVQSEVGKGSTMQVTLPKQSV